DRHETNAQVIKEFYTQKELDNIYVAKSGYVKNNEELVDALTVGVLAAKNDDPVLIVGNNLGDTQESLLKDKKFTKITQVGNGIPAASIQDIKDTQKDPEAKVTGVTLVDYKTVKVTGSELGRITASNITMSGNTVASYTANTAGTEATIVFNSAFKDGTNTITVKSNLGTSTNHTFTYASAISSVEATTTKVKTSGIQYVEFTVNGGQKRSIEELKALGWTVKFNSSESIFYSDRSTASGNKDAYTDTTSTTGKLKTTFKNNNVHTYEVILTKGTETIKSGLKAFEVTNDLNNYNSIKSVDITLGNGVEIVSNTLVKGETATIGNIVAVDKDKNEITLSGSTFTSSNPAVMSINSAGQLTTNSIGSTEITIKNGNLTKSITMYVKAGARKASSVAVDKSSVKIMNSKTDEVLVTVKDQYGDPFKGKSFGSIVAISTTGTPSTQIATATFQNINGSTPETGGISDVEGKLKISITGNNKGTSTLQLKEGTNVLSTIRVEVSDTLTANSWILTKVDATKDLILDVYDEKSDKTLDLILNGYNGGYLIDKESSVSIYNTPDTTAPTTGFWVKSSDESIAGVTATSGNTGGITVTAKKAGKATIQAYKDKKLISSISITVNDTTPVITSIDMKDITNITTSGTITFDVESLFNTTVVKASTSPAPTYDRTIVEGLILSGTTEEVLLGSFTENNITRPVLFVDRGTKNGVYDDGTDLLLASIGMIVDFGDIVIDNKTVSISNNKTGNIIVTIHKGKYNASENPFIAKAITVNSTI
ncbi:cell wall-binding repeat-containing protein, partial [Romboutsia timonensis]|uniref:cell wall-binding repeat-containing protein n=1 Tax=Romboutsia timonensis TaxID=1776391 RepID=UPI002A80ED2C